VREREIVLISDQSMAEDWDLHAVVRSCKSATAKKTINTAVAAAPEDPLACLASLTFEEESDPFSFPHLVEPPRTTAFQELQEFCKSFFPTTTATTSHGINPNSSLSDIQRRRHPVRLTNTSSSIRSHFKPGSPSSTGFVGIQDQQRRQQQNLPYQQRQVLHRQEFQRPHANPSISLPTMQSQAPRSRKR
jgi:WRKY transcription factor 22